MLKPHGWAIITEPGEKDKESDTIICSHCQKIDFIKPKQDPTELGGFCLRCFHTICGPCADDGRCIPFEKKVEQMEARDRMLKSVLGY